MTTTVREQSGLMMAGQEKLHDTLQEIDREIQHQHSELHSLLEVQGKKLNEQSQILLVQQHEAAILRRYLRVTTGVIAAMLLVGVMAIVYIALKG